MKRGRGCAGSGPSRRGLRQGFGLCAPTTSSPLSPLRPAPRLQSSEEVLEWAIENVYKDGDEVCSSARELCMPAAGPRSCSRSQLRLPPCQVHLLHIIPVPMPEVIGGMGAMDSIVTVDPDPQTDLKHVRIGWGLGRGPGQLCSMCLRSLRPLSRWAADGQHARRQE